MDLSYINILDQHICYTEDLWFSISPSEIKTLWKQQQNSSYKFARDVYTQGGFSFGRTTEVLRDLHTSVSYVCMVAETWGHLRRTPFWADVQKLDSTYSSPAESRFFFVFSQRNRWWLSL